MEQPKKDDAFPSLGDSIGFEVHEKKKTKLERQKEEQKKAQEAR